MKIEIAGAGAGKTTNLIDKIYEAYQLNPNHNIFCISFTNSSVDTISSGLEVKFGIIPENIKVGTIHSFLYSEIVKPYNFLLYGVHYQGISSKKLNTDFRLKNSEISKLEKANILHVEKITDKAKFIICGKSGDRKAIKDTRKRLLNSISQGIGAIFVDEAQDIDKNFIDILNMLDTLKVRISLIGDIKQDLKGTGNLKKLIERYPNDVLYIKDCHRCPSKHLLLSNYYIPAVEHQKSLEDKKGEVNLFFESDLDNVNEFIQSRNYDLKYIYNKNDRFKTHRNLKMTSLFEEILLVLKRIDKKNGNNTIDENTLSLNASKISYNLIRKKKNNNVASNKVINSIYKELDLQRDEYAKLIAALDYETTSLEKDGILVDTIERAKGRGEPKCLFIVTPAIMPYLFKEKNSSKMKSFLYVALTRSKNCLDLFFTTDAEKGYSKEKITDLIEAIIVDDV
ncbi:UvrD-helicase domain-containing protein [Lactococcus lactis]